MEGRIMKRNAVFVGLVLVAVSLCCVYVFYKLGVSKAWAQEDCSEVLSLGTETESQITRPFDIEGNSSRVSGNLANTTGAPWPLVIITPKGEDDLAADIILVMEEGPYDETYSQATAPSHLR
jgi:hypothetical protein